MKINALQENLLKATSKIIRIVSSKTQLPILQNILLTAKNDEFYLSSANMENTMSIKVRAKIDKEGSVCVSAKTLFELVASLPQETIHLDVGEGALKIKSNGFSASIPTMPAEDFPPTIMLESSKGARVEKMLFTKVLAKVIFSAATDEGRPLLTGVKFQHKEGKSEVVATDGYRLSVQKISSEIRGVSSGLVIPARALGELIKIGAEEKETEFFVFVPLGDSQLGFIVGDTQLTTRLISGEYPDYEKIIPQKHLTRALIDKSRLARAVKTASIFARDSASVIKLTFDKQLIIVSANAPSVGEGTVEVEAKIDGEGGEIAFNSRFLLDFLAIFPDDELLFEMTGSLNPGVFKPVKDDSYLHIIMPVRTQG